MPRKRKGPKREPSEGGGEPSAAPVNAAATTSVTPAPTEPRRLPSESRTADPDAFASTHKRAKFLSEAEEDRLGKIVGLDRWLEAIGHGRGAAVCICGEVKAVTPPSQPGPVLRLELITIEADGSTLGGRLEARFHADLAQKVAEPLLLLHRIAPPTFVYLSGFAALRTSPLDRGVDFTTNHAVLKISSQPPSSNLTAPTSAIWVEQLATPSAPAPSPLDTPNGGLAPNSSSQTSDWFSTPAPQQQNTDGLSTLPPPPPQPRPPLQTSSSAVTPRPPATVKSEALQRSSSSPNPARASSSRPVSAAPTAPHRNAPHVKPRRMGNCLYTPITMVRDGERASFIGVVVAAGDPRRSTGGTRDLSIKVTIADASCLSGTGYAKELARSMTVMLFAQQTERIPQPIAPGHILAVRNINVQMFSGKPQGVGKSAGAWSWATYDPVSGDVRASENFPLASHTPPECSADEMDHFRDMANWFSELQGVDANVVTRSSRPTLLLKDLAENVFFDTVVEVLKVYTHTLAPDLYVTDYTNHTLFFRGNDKYLRTESTIPYPDDTDGWGHVFQISLWDSHATIAEGLQTGDIIRIQNVRPKLNPRGLLTGGLGSSTDSGIKIRTLKPTDEARIALEQRRARFVETLFAAEEEAFADQAERRFEAAPEPQRPIETEPASDAPIPPTRPPAGAVPEAAGVRSEHTDKAGNAAPQPDHRGASVIVGNSPSGATSSPFPTPAQRHTRAFHEITPSKGSGGDRTAALAASSNANRGVDSLAELEAPELKPGMLMGPPELSLEVRRPLIRCQAPASIPLTALAALQTTSLCPGMYKVRARIISTNPPKVEQWARIECKACKRLLPVDQRFCVKCGDEEGESLAYCLRFAVMLEEVDVELVARKQQSREGSVTKVAIPVLFQGRSSQVLLPGVDAKALYNGERQSVRTLRRFHNRLLHPAQYGKEPEQTLAVYSYPSKEADRTVRRFAALKELNVLHSPMDLL
ncbi:hypothetical protein PANT_2c00018 [Moesziomyces antarcticus T-34]|uniref:Protection of telomeres protein 1 n=1 Tax=Pseudozyma antarctica (strain T-34) TaxID=1151754 RepID=M9MBX9_PSEA3|nr:hypothetical protein PANT_2c00018 [Moesziomyces antarcticus T-34]